MKTIPVLCTFLFLSQTLSAQSNDPAYLTILGWPGTFTQQFNPGIKESRRQIAFGIMLKTLITPVKELRIQVKQALDTAEQTGYPVLFQLDDWNYNPP